ncbi:hypothetical protein T12_13496 [Trichinella patagoniensis]|uniref:Uncharacterized protein n=1 Tax=Trichinella patagoniensis TaxID=990121 RepID=A0A0V0ZWS5_9BILA|nr:hypothetical protein T12_13496 [Trichinella patagoniensis]
MKPDNFDMLKNASHLMSFVLHVISELKVFSVSFCKLTCHLKNQTEKARHQLPSGWLWAESRCFQTGSMKRCSGPQGMLTYSKTCDLHKIKDVLRAALLQRVVVTLNHVNSLNSIEITMRNLSTLFSFYDSSQSYELVI